MKAHGLPPAPNRATSWHTFLRAHWGAISGADFSTTEVWTWRGLVSFYTVFVIDLASRRVQILGATPHPDEAFMRQITRTATTTDATTTDATTCRVLMCDLDAKWSASVREPLTEAGIKVVQTPFQAPNANAYAKRFGRSINEECLDRLIAIGEAHFRRALQNFVAHYHGERNHQGLENALMRMRLVPVTDGFIVGNVSAVCSIIIAAQRDHLFIVQRDDGTERGSPRGLSDGQHAI